jgi:hypothetical protein
MTAKDVKVGETFSCGGESFIRLQHALPLPALRQWHNESWKGLPSREHVCAVDSEFNVRFIHPDNSVELV